MWNTYKRSKHIKTHWTIRKQMWNIHNCSKHILNQQTITNVFKNYNFVQWRWLLEHHSRELRGLIHTSKTLRLAPHQSLTAIPLSSRLCLLKTRCIDTGRSKVHETLLDNRDVQTQEGLHYVTSLLVNQKAMWNTYKRSKHIKIHWLMRKRCGTHISVRNTSNHIEYIYYCSMCIESNCGSITLALSVAGGDTHT